MAFARTALRHDRRLAGVAATVAIHLALIWAWQFVRHAPPPDTDEPASAFDWIWLPPPAPAQAPRPASPQTAEPAMPDAAPQPAQQLAPTQESAPTPATAPAAANAPAPSPPSSHDMLQQAKRDIGRIAAQLTKEFPAKGIVAPADTAQIRFEKGIAEAADMAPNKWYEAPKVKEIIDPGGYGRRRYRVVGARGTYCVTYESNHAPDGLDSMKNGIKPKLTDCDADEQPPTVQKW